MTIMTFIGGGNMAQALLNGLSDNRELELRVADPGAQAREACASIDGVQVFENNTEALENTDCVVLAVKPQLMERVCEPLKEPIKLFSPLVISVAAGIECDALSDWLGGHRRIVRAMPNTPALINAGATGLYGDVSQSDRALADLLFGSVGLVEWVEAEPLINAVTALSGSGPAYFFYMLEAMQAMGVKQGLSAATAQRLAQQTALGAARMALESNDDVSILRKRVTSPGGTTEAAINVLSEQDLPLALNHAMQAASTRAEELAEEFGRPTPPNNS